MSEQIHAFLKVRVCSCKWPGQLRRPWTCSAGGGSRQAGGPGAGRRGERGSVGKTPALQAGEGAHAGTDK